MILSKKERFKISTLIDEEKTASFLYPNYFIIDDDTLNEKLTNKFSSSVKPYPDSLEYKVDDCVFKFNSVVEKWMVK
jgi:hypothetical protein